MKLSGGSIFSGYRKNLKSNLVLVVVLVLESKGLYWVNLDNDDKNDDDDGAIFFFQLKLTCSNSWIFFCIDRRCLFFCPTDCQNLFGIIYRCPQEMKEKLLMFRLVGDEINKQEWLQKLTTGLANTACTADTVCTVFTPLTVTARNTILIRHFWNEKGIGAETRLAIDSGIVTADAPVSYWREIQRRTATRTSLKKWICVPSVFIAIIPTRLLCQM